MPSLPSFRRSLLALAAWWTAAPAGAAPTTPPQDAVEARARAVLLRAHPAANRARLRAGQAQRLTDGRVLVRFRQEHLGLPVAARGATVLLEAGGHGVVRAALAERLPPVLPLHITAPRALELAEQQLPGAFGPEHAKLGWIPSRAGARLAWAFYAGRAPGTPLAPLVVLDAVTGAPLLHLDATRWGRAEVYPANPVATPDPVIVKLSGLPPAAATLAGERVIALGCVDRRTTRTLFGFPVHVCEPSHTATPDAAGDFFTLPADPLSAEDAYAEVSLYHHATRGYERFRELGMPDLDDPVVVVSNLRFAQGLSSLDRSRMADVGLPLAPFDNAFYSPANPLFEQLFGVERAALWFGQGAAGDFAWDGDVVLHELGHAAVDRTIQLVPWYHLDEQGASSAPGAMNEALADFFSSTITGDPRVGEYVDEFMGGAVGRDLSAPDRCPDALTGEVHADATFFSAALWDAREQLPPAEQRDFDRAVMTTLVAAPTGELAFETLALALVETLHQADLGGAAAGLRSAFTRRGVLPRCERLFRWQGTPLRSPAASLRHAFLAPGLALTPVVATSTYAPGVFQVEVPVAPGTRTLAVSFTRVVRPRGLFAAFSRGQRPFAPAVLIAFSGRLTFEEGVAREGELVPATEAAPDRFSATLEVPAGATVAHVMVVNRGDEDGLYTDLSFGPEAGPDAGPDAGSDAAGDAGAPGDDAAAGPGANDPLGVSGGCGCRLPAAHGPAGAVGLLGLVLAGLTLRRNRPGRRRR